MAVVCDSALDFQLGKNPDASSEADKEFEKVVVAGKMIEETSHSAPWSVVHAAVAPYYAENGQMLLQVEVKLAEAMNAGASHLVGT